MTLVKVNQFVIIRTVLLVCCVAFSAPTVAQQRSDVITFGVVPQQSAEKLLKAWGPVMKYLSQSIGQTVRFATAPTIGQFEERCTAGDYDIAYMNPYHYVQFAQNPGYSVLVNQRDKKLKGIFVVRKDSHIKGLSDLQGQTIHLPSPNAFAASLLIQAVLKNSVIEYRTHYAGSHDSVYRNVARGLTKVGAGVVRTFRIQPEGIKSQLRILATTKGYTPHAIAIHPRLHKKQRKALLRALLTVPKDLRSPLKFNPLKQATDEEYNDIRALHLNTVLGK